MTKSERPFWSLWVGQAASLLGSQLVQFALVWWLTKTTGSATTLAMASLAALLPQIIISPFAGVVVDRWNRKWIMLIVDAAIAMATLLLAALFWLNLASVWSICLLLFVRSAGAAFHWPAMQASTTLMVDQEHLGRVAGMNQILSGVASIFIPPLGALAMEALPMQGVLSIDVLTAIPAISILLLIAVPQPTHVILQNTKGSERSPWNDLWEGLRFVVSWKAFMILALIGVMINMLGRAAASLMPLLVLQHFAGGATELGWWQTATGIGVVLGGVVLSIWGGFKRKVPVQMAALILDGLLILLVGFSPREAFLVTIVAISLSGLLEAFVLGLSGAIFQVLVPPELQGRVFALMISLTNGLAPLGLLVAGPISDAYGVTFWWILTGFIIVALGTMALLVPSVVHIEEPAFRLTEEGAAHP